MNKELELTKISDEISKCKKCGLYKKRTNAAPGEGNANTKIMFIGEAPGKKEDETGRPFVGRAGKLLNNLLNSVGIKRKDVFITSVIKCRPPGNRNPKRNEIKACKPYLEKQIEIINPKIIVILGNIALKAMLNENKMKDVHGKLIKKDRNYIPTYHPAAALRFPRFKEKIMEDLKIVKSKMSEV